MNIIIVKVKISNVERWGTDWDDENTKTVELDELLKDIKETISKGCGIDYSTISVELDSFEQKHES